METHSTSPGWAGAHSHVMVRRPTANEPAMVISTSTARPTPTGVARRFGYRSCGDCGQARGPTPPRRCPARGTGARHPSRAGARHTRPAGLRAGPSAPRRPPNAPADPTSPPSTTSSADTDRPSVVAGCRSPGRARRRPKEGLKRGSFAVRPPPPRSADLAPPCSVLGIGQAGAVRSEHQVDRGDARGARAPG
jgi:hypothetical protein